MKYSKVLFAALSVITLASCGNTSQVKETNEQVTEVATATDENTNKIDDSKDENENLEKADTNENEESKEEDKEVEASKKEDESSKKDQTKEASDLLVESDFNAFKGDLMDISSEDPSSLGLVESDKDPEELIDAFFDEELKNANFINYLMVGTSEEESAQKFYGAVEYEDQELFSGHFASIEYDNDKVKNSEEMLLTNNPDSEYKLYTFEQDGSPVGRQVDEDRIDISLNPEIYSVMTNLKKIGSKLKAYESADGATHLYYKADKQGELLDLFRDDYNLEADNPDDVKLEEIVVVTYEDEDSLPDRFDMAIGNDQLKMLINTIWTDYNEVDPSVFEPISIIENKEKVKGADQTSKDSDYYTTLERIAVNLASSGDPKVAVDDYFDMMENSSFYNFFNEESQGHDQEHVEKFIYRYDGKEEIDVQEGDKIVVYRYGEFEDEEVGQTYSLDITLNFVNDMLTLASMSPGFYEVLPNEILNEKELESIKTIEDVDKSVAKPLSLAIANLNETPAILIMVPSVTEDNQYKANYLFFAHDQLVYKTDIPFDQASQDFATAAHKMFREFVLEIGEEF